VGAELPVEDVLKARVPCHQFLRQTKQADRALIDHLHAAIGIDHHDAL
jgi:hypothetical protein